MKLWDYMFENTNWKAVSAEIMGTFFLVFFGVSSLANNVGVTSDETGRESTRASICMTNIGGSE